MADVKVEAGAVEVVQVKVEASDISALPPAPEASTNLKRKRSPSTSPSKDNQSPVSTKPKLEQADAPEKPPQAVLDEQAKIAGVITPDDVKLYLAKWKDDIKNKVPPFRKKKPIPDGPDFILKFCIFAEFSDNVVRMTPKLKAATRIDQGLALLINPANNFPQGLIDRAQVLMDKWTQENWGADEDEESESAEQDQPFSPISPTTSGPAPVRRSVPKEIKPNYEVRFPPEDHPIWGLKGIMHGLYINNGKPQFDYRYKKRSFKAHGHNGLKVGQWFPQQRIAFFWGAHGSLMGGISGTESGGGAYSIVVSGKGAYEDLDKDEGKVLYYSGSGSHKNTDPAAPANPTLATRALRKSLENGREVRVLRSAAPGSARKWPYPKVGYRYDGLYRVTDHRHRKNLLGGLYEQFKLERLPSQESLESIMERSPTFQEELDYAKIEKKY